MKVYALVLIGLFMYGCATVVPVTVHPEPPKTAPPVVQTPASKSDDENIDTDGLKNFLKLNRRYDRLGFIEKTFNTCEIGFGYSATHRCRSLTFVVLNFQLMCRDSEGTVTQALRPSDLRAISRQSVRWNLKNASGKIITDSEGYGQIAMISGQSQRYQRLKLAVRNDFLFMKAGELTQMITPKSWCN